MNHILKHIRLKSLSQSVPNTPNNYNHSHCEHIELNLHYNHSKMNNRVMLHSYYRDAINEEDRWRRLEKRMERHWNHNNNVIIK